jgi:hypothetical protein
MSAGSTLASLYAVAVGWWRWVDWQAASAIAVAMATCMALIPILRDWRRGRRVGKVVRARIHAELIAVRPVVKEIFDRIPATGGFNVPQHRAPVEALQALLAHAQFLKAKETAKVVDLVTTLGVAAKVYPLNAGEAFPELLHDLDDVIERLSR